MAMKMWVWVNTYRYIFSGMNIHLPAILGFTRYQGFDPSPCGGCGVEVTRLPIKTPPSRPLRFIATTQSSKQRALACCDCCAVATGAKGESPEWFMFLGTWRPR